MLEGDGSSRPADHDNHASTILGETSSHKRDHGFLEGRPLWLAVLALNVANGVAFVDLLGLSAVLPVVSNHFNGSETIEFATTAQLVGACAGQCLLGYLSDISSRRNMLLVALGLLVFTGVMCGSSFYTSAPTFFTALRAIAGIGLGSVSNLVNVAQNDIATERRRQELQGVQGASVALGSIIGVLVSAALAGSGQWQIFYFLQAGLSVLAAIGIYSFVPPQYRKRSPRTTGDILKTIDYFGITTFTVSTTCGLLLLCKYNKMSETLIIVLGSLTAVFAILFAVSNFRNLPGVRPIIPFHLFRNRTIAAIYLQNVLFGNTYYSFIYFTPITLQAVRKISLLEAASYLVPYFLSHGISSTISARIVRALKDRGHRSFSIVFFFAFAVWTLAMGLLAWDSTAQRGRSIIAIGVLVGVGTGCVFQNSVMAIAAQVDRETKAVAVGTRNVLRYFGGAIGVAQSSTIIQTALKHYLPNDLENRIHSAAVFDLALDDLSREEQRTVHRAYAKAIAMVFFATTALIALCLILNVFVQDGGRERIQDPEKSAATLASLHRVINGMGLGRPERSDTTKDAWAEDVVSSTPSLSASGQSTPMRQDSHFDAKMSLASTPSSVSLSGVKEEDGEVRRGR